MNDYLRYGSHPLNEWLTSGDVSMHYVYKTRREANYVQELIGDEWRHWNPQTPVFISTQTGTGKTTFIDKEIIRSVLTDNRHNHKHSEALFCLNRTSLHRQEIYSLSESIMQYTGEDFCSQLDDYTDEGLDKHIHRLGDVYIITYQHLASSDGQKLLQSHDFAYVILDESHFFTMDALFNATTGAILNNIVHLCQSSVRIYMSATLETAFEPIIRAEYGEWRKRHDPPHTPHDDIFPFTAKGQMGATLSNMLRRLDHHLERFSFKYYDLERNYEYVTLKSYDPNELENIISSASGRRLSFVLSKEEGQKLKKNLTEKNKDLKVVFLTRDSKGTIEFGDLVKNEAFDADILISTAVIDNGINIKDAKITDVFIAPFDRTEYLQMLGRVRRVNDCATLQLWMPSWNKDELEKLLKNELRKLIDRLSLNGLSKEAKDALIGTYLRQKDGFSVNAVEGLYYSPLSVYPLLESIQRITSILRNINPDFALDLDDSVYQSRVFKAFYDAADGKLPMADAICRTLLGLKFLDESDYLESQIAWKKTKWEDDSFLYIIYEMRLHDIEESLKSRSLGDMNQPNSHIPQPIDRHPTLSDEELKEQLRRQETLIKRFGKSQSALEEAMHWLELAPPKQPTPPPVSFDIITVEEALREISVTENEFRSIVGNDKICHDEKFFDAHALRKDKFETLEKECNAKSIAFGALRDHFAPQIKSPVTPTKLTHAAGKSPLELPPDSFVLVSLRNTNKDTYYAIVRKNSNTPENFG